MSIARAQAEVGNGRVFARRAFAPVRLALLERAYRACRARRPRVRRRVHEFADRISIWIHDYALFRALKHRFNWSPWETWPEDLAMRSRGSGAARRELAIRSRCTAAGNSSRIGNGQRCAHTRTPRVHSAATWRSRRHATAPRSGRIRRVRSIWTVGAPPDEFNSAWATMGPAAAAMARDASGRAFACGERVRARRAMFDLWRIDHVVGNLSHFFDERGFPRPTGPSSPPKRTHRLRRAKKLCAHCARRSAMRASSLKIWPRAAVGSRFPDPARSSGI